MTGKINKVWHAANPMSERRAARLCQGRGGVFFALIPVFAATMARGIGY